jgi:hypothetical protein
VNQAIYVMQGEGRIKVGISKSPSSRRSALARGLDLIYSASPGRGRARELEIRAHEILAEHRISGEWFSVDATAAVDAVLQAADELGLALTGYEDEKCRILIRVQPETKAALEMVAAEQERSVSFLLDKIAVAWLQQHGHLKAAKRKAK